MPACSGRPSDNPLIVHVATEEHFRRLVLQVPPLVETIARVELSLYPLVPLELLRIIFVGHAAGFLARPAHHRLASVRRGVF